MTQKKFKPGQKPGTVEDAAKALKESQNGGSPEDKKEGDDKAGEDNPPGAGTDGDSPEGQDNSNVGAGDDNTGTGPEGEQPPAETPPAMPPIETGANAGDNLGPESQNGGSPEVKDRVEEPKEMTTPVPDAEACKEFGERLSNSPAHLEAFRETIAIADRLIAERNAAPKKTLEEMEVVNYQRLVNQYGKDFVTAKRGTNKGYFSRKAWNAMKQKRGWEEIVKTMPEVQEAAAPSKPEALDEE